MKRRRIIVSQIATKESDCLIEPLSERAFITYHGEPTLTHPRENHAMVLKPLRAMMHDERWHLFKYLLKRDFFLVFFFFVQKARSGDFWGCSYGVVAIYQHFQAFFCDNRVFIGQIDTLDKLSNVLNLERA